MVKGIISSLRKKTCPALLLRAFFSALSSVRNNGWKMSVQPFSIEDLCAAPMVSWESQTPPSSNPHPHPEDPQNK